MYQSSYLNAEYMKNLIYIIKEFDRNISSSCIFCKNRTCYYKFRKQILIDAIIESIIKLFIINLNDFDNISKSNNFNFEKNINYINLFCIIFIYPIIYIDNFMLRTNYFIIIIKKKLAFNFALCRNLRSIKSILLNMYQLCAYLYLLLVSLN